MNTAIVFTSPLRRRARKTERDIQAALDCLWLGDPSTAPKSVLKPLEKYNIPDWAKGARVEKAGWFSWAVVVTESRGH